MEVEALFPISAPWTTTTLGDVCRAGGGDIQTGPFGSQLHAADYVPVGIPSVMPQNIGDNRINEEGIARITAADANRLSRYLLREGDIVYSRRGDVERRSLIRTREDGWLCGTGCLRVRFGQGVVHPPYAAYYLGHPAVREWIVRHAHGATMLNLNTSILSALPLVCPTLTEQRTIAHILGTLDDKIELNRRSNETLEAMARALFKDWFVDFGPVRAKMEERAHQDGARSGQPRKPLNMASGLPWPGAETGAGAQGEPYLAPELWSLFPETLDDDNKPAGWRWGTLAAVAESRNRGVLPAEVSADTPYIGLEHMPRKAIALWDWEGAGKVTSNKSRFTKGEILFGKLRPYFHKVGVAPIDGICSTDIIVMGPTSNEWTAFVLMCASSDEFVAYTDRSSTGTKMPRTSWRLMGSYPMLLPPSSLTSAFNELVVPLVDRMQTNIYETKTLATLRDTLLPKLLSGELRVRDAEQLTEAQTA